MTEQSKQSRLSSRNDALRAILKWEQAIRESFDDGVVVRDWFDNVIDGDFAFKYVQSQRLRLAEVLYQTVMHTPGRTVCEIGAAFGSCLLPLAKDYGFNAEAFDIPENTHCYCKPLKTHKIDVREHDLHDPEEGMLASADFVICSEVVEHIFVNMNAVARQLKRFVRVGGRALITTPNQYRMENFIRIFRGYNACEPHPQRARMRNGIVVDARTHPREYTMFEVAEAFQSSSDWKLIKVWTWPHEPVSLSTSRDYLRMFLLKAFFRLPFGRFVFCVAERVN